MRRQAAMVGALMVVLLCAACDTGGEQAGEQEDGRGDAEAAGSNVGEDADAPEAPQEALEDRETSPEGQDPEEGSDELQAPSEDPEAPGTDQPEAENGGSCEPDVLAAIDGTIAGQLEAFAADDFERALGFASAGFQRGIDVPSFQALIESEFPVVADATDHEVVFCVRLDQRAAQARVMVTGSDGTSTDMAYVLVEESGGWGIDGAAEISGPTGRIA